MRTFTCEMCQGVFERERTDAEVQKEYERLFGESPDPKAMVCHNCWLAMGCDQIGVHKS